MRTGLGRWCQVKWLVKVLTQGLCKKTLLVENIVGYKTACVGAGGICEESANSNFPVRRGLCTHTSVVQKQPCVKRFGATEAGVVQHQFMRKRKNTQNSTAKHQFFDA